MSDRENNIINLAAAKRVRVGLLVRTKVTWEWRGNGLTRTQIERCPEDQKRLTIGTSRCPHQRCNDELTD